MSFEQDHRIPMSPEHDVEATDEIPYEESRTRSRFPGVLIGLVIAAILMGGAFWWGYDLGQSKESGLFPPLIQADRAPIKEAPEEPGGLQVPNQESLVFDGVAGDADAARRVGVLATPPEEPLARSDARRIAQQRVVVQTSAAGANVPDARARRTPTESARSELPLAPPPLAEADLSATPLRRTAPTERLRGAPSARVATTNTIAAEPLRDDQVAAVSRPAVPRTISRAPSETARPAVASPVRTAVAAPLAVLAAGAFRVQVGSYRTEAAALDGWNILRSAHVSLLRDLSPTIVSADLGARGVFHRLQAGPFVTRGAADTLCNSLKARNQGCLVVRR